MRTKIKHPVSLSACDDINALNDLLFKSAVTPRSRQPGRGSDKQQQLRGASATVAHFADVVEVHLHAHAGERQAAGHHLPVCRGKEERGRRGLGLVFGHEVRNNFLAVFVAVGWWYCGTMCYQNNKTAVAEQWWSISI